MGETSVEDQQFELDADTCVELLDLESVGRAAFVLDGRPQVQVVTYLRRDDRLELCAPAGSPLARVVGGDAVAVQIDQVDRDLLRGWVVVATGAATVGAASTSGARTVLVGWTELVGRWIGPVGRSLRVQVDGRPVRVPAGAP